MRKNCIFFSSLVLVKVLNCSGWSFLKQQKKLQQSPMRNRNMLTLQVQYFENKWEVIGTLISNSTSHSWGGYTNITSRTSLRSLKTNLKDIWRLANSVKSHDLPSGLRNPAEFTWQGSQPVLCVKQRLWSSFARCCSVFFLCWNELMLGVLTGSSGIAKEEHVNIWLLLQCLSVGSG